MNNIPKKANLGINGAREMQFGMFNGREDGKQTQQCTFMETHEIFMTQKVDFFLNRIM